MARKKLDEFHYHEALDRANSINIMIEELLTFHPVIKKHKDIQKELDKATRSITEVYCMVSKESDEIFNK